MWRVVAVLSVLAVVALSDEAINDPKRWKCCLPEQWEGWSTVVKGISLGPHAIVKSSLIRFSYDYHRKMVVFRKASPRRNIRVIMDFSKKKYYLIVGHSCFSKKLSKPMFYCFPESAAEQVKHFYQGYNGNKLIEKYFRFVHEGKPVYMTTTSNGCVPINEVHFERRAFIVSMVSINSMNVTIGIKDPSVFGIPKTCHPGTALIWTTKKEKMLLETIGRSVIFRL